MARERGAPRARDLHLGTGLDPTCPLSGAEKLTVLPRLAQQDMACTWHDGIDMHSGMGMGMGMVRTGMVQVRTAIHN